MISILSFLTSPTLSSICLAASILILTPGVLPSSSNASTKPFTALAELSAREYSALSSISSFNALTTLGYELGAYPAISPAFFGLP